MSASVGDGNGQDVELNLAPIIDCFTVLITYLLITASFITLASVDVSVSSTNPSAGAPPPSNAPPPITMALELKANGEIGIQVRGGTLKETKAFSVQSSTGTWDLAGLTSRLKEIQTSWPALTEVSVTAEPSVIYKDIVGLLHEIQNVMPKVYISG
jgi:biopolymer transport protein ExbD